MNKNFPFQQSNRLWSQILTNWLESHKCCFCLRSKDKFIINMSHQNLTMGSVKYTQDVDNMEQLKCENNIPTMDNEGFI